MNIQEKKWRGVEEGDSNMCINISYKIYESIYLLNCNFKMKKFNSFSLELVHRGKLPIPSRPLKRARKVADG